MNNKVQNSKIMIPLSFLTLGLKYLKLVSNTFEENINQNNVHMVMSDSQITEDLYDKKTKWSDFNIIEPTLFNLYHGLELIMKGLLHLMGDATKPEHGLEELLGRIRAKSELPDSIQNILAKHIDTSFINAYIYILKGQ